MAIKLFIFVSALGLINAAYIPTYLHHHPGYINPAPAAGPPQSIHHPIVQHPVHVHPLPVLHPVPQYVQGQQQALSFAQNGPGYEAAISSANSQGYGTALSSAHNAPGYQSTFSLANSHGSYGNYGTSIAAALNAGAHKLSLAESVQHNGNSYQNSGATSIIAPGLESAQSHAINYGG